MRPSPSIGNTLYECNCWAGGIDAVMSLPGASKLDSTNPDHTTALTGITVGCSVGYAVIVMVLLYMNKTDILGIFLGFSRNLCGTEWSFYLLFIYFSHDGHDRSLHNCTGYHGDRLVQVRSTTTTDCTI